MLKTGKLCPFGYVSFSQLHFIDVRFLLKIAKVRAIKTEWRENGTQNQKRSC